MNDHYDQTEFQSDDGLVKVRTTTKPRRWPPHRFPVVLIELKPRRGTRVLQSHEGITEWMPRHSELRAVVEQMGLSLTTQPSDKPQARRKHYEQVNARRLGRHS
jgi:hypothetical protein